MTECDVTASKIFNNAHRFIEAYYTVLQPICKKYGLPPMAVDILLFIANNPENNVARDICLLRGFKPGIVSVHIERLVNEDLLKRMRASDDRRKTQLVFTEKANSIIDEGRELQGKFASKLLAGLNESDIEIFKNCLSVLNDNMEIIRKNGI